MENWAWDRDKSMRCVEKNVIGRWIETYAMHYVEKIRN